MRQDKLSIKKRLMYYCARNMVDSSTKKQLENLLKTPLQLTDWTWIAEQSLQHGILSLFYYNIIKTHGSSIPESILTISEEYYYSILAKNMQLWIEFCRIQNALNKAGVETLPLKGIILAHTLYQNSGLRPMGDIDILIKKKNLNAAKGKLTQLGYQMVLKGLTEDYWIRHHCHLGFSNSQEEIVVELHWALAPPRPNKINIDEIWLRSKIKIVNCSKMLVLSHEDMLLSLCLHICKNVSDLQFLKLKNLCDIHELISQYAEKLNWDYILEKIVSWRLRGAIFYVYLLTKIHLGTSWPEKNISKIKPGIIQSAALSFFARDIPRGSRFQAYLLMLTMQDTAADCIMLIWQRVATFFQK